MIFPHQRKLFTSAEVCRACGISRTSLFRLEEAGFLKPYHVNPETGYRYYDLQNITAIGQYQSMQALGMSRKEIMDMYYDRTDGKEFLETQRQKLKRMQRFLDAYELHRNPANNYSASFITLPEVSCYCSDIDAHTPEDIAKQNYLAHEKCVENGYRMRGSEPLFAVYEDRNEWARSSDYHYTLCIPVYPHKDQGPNVRTFKETLAFSVTGFGEYSVIPKLCGIFWEEFDKQDLVPSGPPRVIMHIGAYAGAHFKPENFCYECALPIEPTDK